jgi:heptosyltransferase III
MCEVTHSHELLCREIPPVSRRNQKRALRYRLDRGVRNFVMALMTRLTPDLRDEKVELQPQKIRKILIVRSLFRMGDAILATPAIRLFRNNFPAARIDFVGPPISKRLFENLPIDRHYAICKTFPRAGWSYIGLLKQLRATKYDLAFDASGSSAALGSLIVGFSGARLRVGLIGKWDRWFNVRLDRPSGANKYDILPNLIGSLGLETKKVYPKLLLTPAEINQANARIHALVVSADAPIIGVFVGGRKARGKRWQKEKFADLVGLLSGAGAQPIIFVGPEEHEWLGYFRQECAATAPTVFEPDVRKFAALVTTCDLFVTCDGGPMHLACALRVRTIAIFLASDVNRWAPPVELGRIISGDDACVDTVFQACREELQKFSKKITAPIGVPAQIRASRDKPHRGLS